MVELHTRYLGLDLRTPLVASASPLTGSLEGLRRLEAAGAAAVVLPSLFEEQLTLEADQVGRLLEGGADSLSAALTLDDYAAGPYGYLALVEKATATLRDPGDRQPQRRRPRCLGGARQPAGGGRRRCPGTQHLLCVLPPGAGRLGGGVAVLELVRSVRQSIGIPLAVKLSPYFSSVANLTRQLVEAGAEWLVLFNRFYQPDLDLETLEVTPRLVLSTSEELRLPLRWIAILHKQVPASLAASTGVHTAADVVKVLLAGAMWP